MAPVFATVTRVFGRNLTVPNQIGTQSVKGKDFRRDVLSKKGKGASGALGCKCPTTGSVQIVSDMDST